MGQLELVAKPGGFDPRVRVGASQPYRAAVGLYADAGLEADGACDAYVASFDGEAVDADLAASVAAAVVAVIEHDENVDRNGGQPGGPLDGDQAVRQEALLVVGGNDHADPSDLAAAHD